MRDPPALTKLALLKNGGRWQEIEKRCMGQIISIERIFNKAIEEIGEVSKMEDRRLEKFYLSLFKTSEKRWRRIAWRANKKRYGMTPWDLAKKWGRNWRRE